MVIKKSTPAPAFLIGLILLVVAFILSIADRTRKTKQALAEIYHIDRRTLANWIEHFQTEITLEDWNKKKKLTAIEWINLRSTFGTDVSLVSNKKSLAARSGASYKTLSETVKANLSRISITSEAWEACSCMPPAISNRIIKIMDGEYDEWLISTRPVSSEMLKEIHFNQPPSDLFLPSYAS